MRILMQNRSFLPNIGGAEVRFFNLARALAALGHDVTVFAPYSAASSQQSAVSGQRSAVSGQRSAVSGQRSGDAPDPRPSNPEPDGPTPDAQRPTPDAWPGFRVVRYPLAEFFFRPSGSYWRSLWLPRRHYRFSRVEVDAMPAGPWDFVYTGVREFALRLKRERPGECVLFAPGGTVFGLKAEYYPGTDRLLSLWGFRQRLTYRQAVRYERLAARVADAVLAQTDLVARVFREEYGIDPAKVRRLNHGVDLERFHPGGVSSVECRVSSAARQKLAIRHSTLDTSSFLIAFVGRLAPEKNLPFLFDALARPEARGAHAVLVGDGPEAPRLKALAAQLGLSPRITFAGLHRNVEDYLAAADPFVLPSTSETFGIALAEAMAAGLPTIALRPDFGRINTGVAEHIEEGVTGFLVDPDDPGDLAAKIGALVADPVRAHQMGLAGRRAAELKFNWAAIARQLLAIAADLRQG